MTDLTKLKELAEKLASIRGIPSLQQGYLLTDFSRLANPQAILGLIAEVERLNDELSACTEHPGGCGYWREAAKHRAEERDQIQAEIERFKDANREISETNTRQRDENVRLKAENEALRKAFDEANEMLARIGDFAHDKSAGPAVPDALWEIRSMAYSAVRIGFDIALEGGGK